MPRPSSGPARSGRWANEEPRDLNNPRPGHYRLRLVRGGPYVAAAIVLNGTSLSVVVGFGEASCDAADIERVWLRGETITHEEYTAMRSRAAEARRSRPHDPLANPQAPASMMRMRPPF